MEKLRRHLLLITLFVQLIFMAIGFKGYWNDPVNFVFSPYWDGQHSNFTYLSHLLQPKEKGITFLQQQNYPFGDYIFYQDNALVFSVPIKLCSDYVIDLKPYKYAFYNFFHILGVFFCTLFLFLILKRFVQNMWLHFAASIALAWINPQIFRLEFGHSSLSYSWILVGALYWLIRLYEEKNNPNKWYFLLTFWVLIGSFCHFYYLAILATLIMPTHIVSKWFQQNATSLPEKIKQMLAPSAKIVGVFFAAYLVIFSIIKFVDKYNHLRNSATDGYDNLPWKFNLSYAFSGYEFLRFPWFVKSANLSFYESTSYLGGFALFFFTFLFLLRIFAKQLLLKSSQWIADEYKALWKGFCVAALIALFISLGDNYPLFDGAYNVKNYFNPLMYLNYFSPLFTQFRCLGRFLWVWWWILGIFSFILVDKYVQLSQPRGLKYVFLGFTLFLGLDTYDFLTHFNTRNSKDNIISAEVTKDLQNRFKNIDLTQFQAMLPLPYYHVGVASRNYTIDGSQFECIEANQISHFTHLPMMAMQNARAVDLHNRAMFSMFCEDEVAPLLRQNLNDKPILVILRKASLNADSASNNTFIPPADIKPAHNVGLYGHRIVLRYNMEKMGEDDRYVYYRWFIKRDYKARKEVPKYPEKLIQETMEMIRQNKEWNEKLTQKANELHSSLDSTLRSEALYWLEMK